MSVRYGVPFARSESGLQVYPKPGIGSQEFIHGSGDLYIIYCSIMIKRCPMAYMRHQESN